MHRKFLVALALVVLAAPALAQSRAGRSDFYFSPTFTNSQNFTSEGGTAVQVDNGTGFGFGWDYNFDAHWAGGLEFAWGDADWRATVQPGEGNTSGTRRINGTILTTSLRFTGTYNLASGPLTPFLAFNAGWTSGDTGIPDGLPQNLCWYYPWWGSYCGTYVPTKTTTRFSYGAGLGVRLDIGRSFVLRGMASQQYVDFGNYSGTPWTQWRVDLGARF